MQGSAKVGPWPCINSLLKQYDRFLNAPPKVPLNAGGGGGGGYPHTKSTVMESSLPAGFRPKKISLNVGGLIKQVLGLFWGYTMGYPYFWKP